MSTPVHFERHSCITNSLRGPLSLRRRGASSATVPIAVVAIVAILAIVWMYRPGPDVEANRAEQHRTMMQALGNTPDSEAGRKMASRFVDSNGDLVAEGPADASKVIDPDTLTFTYIANPSMSAEVEQFRPWADYLAKTTGKKVELVAYDKLDDQLLALRDGTLHVAAFNTGAVPIAVNAAGFVPVAVLGTASDVATYRVKIIVRADSPVRAIEDLRRREITFTEPSSNSGFKAPFLMLKEQGLEPMRDYDARYSYSHDASIKGIADGTYVAAAVASDALDRALQQGVVKPEQFRVIYESPETYPTAAFGYSCLLKPELAAKVKQGLLEFKWANTSVATRFAGSGQTRLIEANYEDRFDSIRKIDANFSFRYAIIADEPTTSPTTAPAAP